MSSQNEHNDGREPVYGTQIQCDECLEYFTVSFRDPESSFSATCPHCNTHYPELYV